MDSDLKALHSDLARKFRLHGTRIEQMWRSFSPKQREKVMRDGSRDGVVLKNHQDTSLGNVYKFVPEWNIRDITSSPDYFVRILKHRATTQLQEQYIDGVSGGPGDHAHIVEMMQKKNLQLINASQFKDCYTLFYDEEKYGRSVTIKPGHSKDVLAALRPAVDAQLIVPQATGELILMRQISLLQTLNIAVEDILDAASTTRTQTKRPKKPADVATAALAQLSLHETPKKFELSHLATRSLDQKASLEDYVNLISTEATILAHDVNLWFFTRPELVADERGRVMPVHTDKYISGAVFDAIHSAVKAAAVWSYITRLLALLESSHDKQFRVIILQELSNTCHLEYTRAQSNFKRHVSTGSGGNKWFKRMSTVRKDGIARISMKRSPESLTVENPQLHYMLRLCLDETNWTTSAEWLQKLEDLHRAHPVEKENMTEREYDSLGDLAIIVTFTQALSSLEKLPPVTHKQHQAFPSGYLALENELRDVKSGIDLGDFAIPIDNLLEPGMAVGALTTLDNYILEKTGSKLGFLYQDLVEDCVSNILKR
jgi:hypothetical protein